MDSRFEVFSKKFRETIVVNRVAKGRKSAYWL